MDIQRPAIPQCTDWNKLEMLNREKEMIGMYLSSHPLDDYGIVIKQFANTKLSQLANLNDMRDKDFTVAGMVTDVQNLHTKSGKPFGRFKLEDYSGQYEFALFDKDYENFRKYLYNDYFLLIRGSVRERKYRPGDYEVKINSIQMLGDALESLNELTLIFPVEEISHDMTAELQEYLAASAKEKGKVTLRIKVTDPHEGITLSLRSRKYKITLTHELIAYLDHNDIHYSVA